MTWLLVTNYEKEPAQWQRDLRQHVKDIEVRGFSDEYDPAMIEVILTDCPLQSRGGFGLFTNLKWVHFLGHGVGDVLHDPSLRTGIIVTRQHQQSTADSLTQCRQEHAALLAGYVVVAPVPRLHCAKRPEHCGQACVRARVMGSPQHVVQAEFDALHGARVQTESA